MLYMIKPPLNNLSEYFKRYISQVKEENLLNALIDQNQSFTTYLKFIPTNKEDFRYDIGKWSIKEIIQHIIDTERVFAFRALSFSRNDGVALPSFDQDIYVDNSNANNRTINDLIHEFDIVRQSTICLYKSFTEKQLKLKGLASDRESTPLILGFAIVGHCQHHINIMDERYL